MFARWHGADEDCICDGLSRHMPLCLSRGLPRPSLNAHSTLLASAQTMRRGARNTRRLLQSRSRQIHTSGCTRVSPGAPVRLLCMGASARVLYACAPHARTRAHTHARTHTHTCVRIWLYLLVPLAYAVENETSCGCTCQVASFIHTHKHTLCVYA